MRDYCIAHFCSSGCILPNVTGAGGLSQQYFSGLENGRRNPTVVTLHEVAAALGVQPMELLRPFKTGGARTR